MMPPFVEHVWISRNEHRVAGVSRGVADPQHYLVLTDRYFAWRTGVLTASFSALSPSPLKYSAVQLSRIDCVEIQSKHMGLQKTLQIHLSDVEGPGETLEFGMAFVEKWINGFKSLGIRVVENDAYSYEKLDTAFRECIWAFPFVCVVLGVGATVLLSLLFDSPHFVRNTSAGSVILIACYLIFVVWAFTRQ